MANARLNRSTPCSSACASAGPPGEKVARKLYILCTDPPLAYLRKFYEWASDAPGWEVKELATGHDAMITQPKI